VAAVEQSRPDSPAIELREAGVRLGGRRVWGEVTISVHPGEFVALLGANGSGKSTLLKVLLGALALDQGAATVLGRAPGRANSSIGYLPQRRAFDAGMRLRGRDIVRLGLDGDRWGLPLTRPRGVRTRRTRASRRRSSSWVRAHTPRGQSANARVESSSVC
jgi:zinc/manganese transport system ATP-binding protein